MNLREKMPQTASFIDEMREAFGIENINASIKAGMNGVPVFYARENGLEIGRKDDRVGLPLSKMVIASPAMIMQATEPKKSP